MVHALSEIRRVLAADGVMIDLRPLHDRWPVEVVSAHEVRETGRVQDLPGILADDEAANRAIAEAAQKGWFLREREESFSYDYSWDAPSEMEEWIETEWQDFIAMDEETKRATRSAWAMGEADSRVQLRVKILITKWRVLQSASFG
jgi:hypothetical protein